MLYFIIESILPSCKGGSDSYIQVQPKGFYLFSFLRLQRINVNRQSAVKRKIVKVILSR